MNAIRQTHTVPLADIDIADNPYNLCPWEESPSDALLASIKMFGILHPPILLHQLGKYKVVAGRKRILAAQICTQKQNILCHVLPPETKHKTICSFLLEEALNGRPLSIVEQISFFEIYLQTSASDDALPLLEKLGHKPQEHVLQNLIKLRSLSDDTLLALHHGIVPVKNAYKLLTFSPADQKIIIKLINELGLGGSKQRKLIELSAELIIRENNTLKQILSECHCRISQENKIIYRNMQQRFSPGSKEDVLLSFLPQKTPLNRR